MKKLFMRIAAGVALLASNLGVQAQVSSYQFAQSTGTYTSLTGTPATGAILATPTGNTVSTSVDNAVYPVSGFPFTFTFNGVGYTSCNVSSNGFITFGATAPGIALYTPISGSTAYTGAISAFGADLNSFFNQNGRTGEMRWDAVGTAPNREIVFQWKDWRPAYTVSTTNVYGMNAQIRLQENGNVIRVVYDPGSFAVGSTAVSGTWEIGLRGASNADYNSRTNAATVAFTASTLNNPNVNGSVNTATQAFNTNATPPGMPTTGLTYTYTPPPACVAPVDQPTGFASTATSYSGISGSLTAASSNPYGYLIVRYAQGAAPTAPVAGTTYAVGNSLGTGTVVSAGPSTSFTASGLASNTAYDFYAYAYNGNPLVCINPAYNTTSPPSFTATTVSSPKTYTWTGTAGTDWQAASNWSPSRALTDATDTLIFDGSTTATVTATNVPTQTTGAARFLNAVGTTLQSGTAQTLTAAAGVTVSTGSALTLGSTVSLTTSANATNTLNGTLTLAGSSNTFTVNTSSTNTVGPAGIVNNGGTISGMTAANTTFSSGSSYNHTRDGGTVPTATYASGSTVNVTGIVAATSLTVPATIGGNLIYNCTGQTSTNCTFSSVLTTLGGTFTQLSTGASGSFQFGLATSLVATGAATISGGTLAASGGSLTFNGGLTVAGGTITGTTSGAATSTISTTNLTLSSGTISNNVATYANNYAVSGNFTQSGGTISSSSATASILTFSVGGTFNQSAGTITQSSTGSIGITFNGAALQAVTFGGTNTTGIINYTVNNVGGINLTGTLNVNNGALLLIGNAGSGAITGSGTVAYGSTSGALRYTSTSGAVTTTSVEWPTTNGPVNLTFNVTGAAPANRITLHASRSLPATGVLTLTSGVLVLGANTLSILNPATAAIAGTGSATNMVAADGTGQLVRAVGTTAATTYNWPIGDITGTVEYSPVSITFATNALARNFGFRVVNAQHPSDASATNYLKRYWVSTDDQAASAYTYSAAVFNGVAADLVGGNIRLNAWNGATWAQYPSTAAAAVLTTFGTLSSAQQPLGSLDFTGRPTVSASYTFTPGAATGDFAAAASWTPNRATTDPSDILIFDGAQTGGPAFTATNIPTAQSVAQLRCINNVTAALQANATANATLTLVSDNNSATNELDIAAGSTLLSNGTAKVLGLAFSGSGNTANIAGTLEVANTVVVNTVSFTNSVATVPVGGVLAAGGSVTTAPITSSATTLQVNGTYTHKYTTVGGTIPTASWNTGSTCAIIGYTSNSTATSGVSQTFSNFTWNCPGQTGNLNLAGTLPTVTGTFTVANTGSGQLRLTGTTVYTATVNNFAQTGGTLDLAFGAASGPSLSVTGSFNQSGGTLLTTAGTVTLNFSGTTGQQAVNFFNAAPAGSITYRISNAAGINLTGSGTLTGAFAINNGGGIRISSNVATPITTTLTPTYATGTTLTYDYTGSGAMTSTEFPAANGPFNLTVAVGSGNSVTQPFSRTVGGTLTMTSGDIDLGTYALALGTSVAAPGTLSYTAGAIRVTSGSLTRWYPTTGLPTSAGTAIGYYPLAAGTSSRAVAVYFSTATALSAGGTIAVSHTGVAGTAPVSPSFTDAGATIDTRSQSSWSLATGNGLALTGTAGLRLTGAGVITPSQTTNLRLIRAADAVGTNAAPGGTIAVPTVGRTGLALSDLTNTFYFGLPVSDLSFVATTSGNWGDGATWDRGAAPGTTDAVVIGAGTTVTLAGASGASGYTASAGTLTVNSTGTLLSAEPTNVLNIASQVTNNGTITLTAGTITISTATASTSNGYTGASGSTLTLNGGTLTQGPSGGGNLPFLMNSGSTFTLGSGNLNVNGNVRFVSGSTITQTGGTVTIDGNSGTAATSVATGTAHFYVRSGTANSAQFSGGTILVVDPPHSSYSASSTSTLDIGTTAVNTVFGGTHTIQMGDGVSTTPGNSDGFVVETYASTSQTPINNLIVNGGSTTGRWTAGSKENNTAYGTHLKGTLTINAGSEFRTAPVSANSIDMSLGGNIVNNGTFTNLASSSVNLGGNSGYTFTPATQTISGTGVFQNATSGSTAGWRSVTLNNANGVTLATPMTVSSTLTFSTGTLTTTNSNLLTLIAGAGVSSASNTSFVNGPVAKTGTTSFTFPVGKTGTGYQPIDISAPATAATFKAEYLRASAAGLGAKVAGLTRVSGCEYWTLDRTAGTATTNVKLTWNATSNCGAGSYVTDPTSAVVAHFNTTTNTWDAYGGDTRTGTAAAGTVTWNAVSNFSPFALGTTAVGTANPLPVSFLSLTARAEGARNRVEWTTGAEETTGRYEVEKEQNGAFEPIGTLPAQGRPATYAFNDEKPVAGRNAYRIKAVDASGAVSYSQTAVVLVKDAGGFALETFPNPATDKLVVRSVGAASATATLTVTDLTGRVLLTQQDAAAAATLHVAPLPAGVYLLHWTDGTHHEAVRITKQ